MLSLESEFRVLRGHIEKVKVEYDEKKEDDKKKEVFECPSRVWTDTSCHISANSSVLISCGSAPHV